MWLTLVVLCLAGAAGLHFWWRRRFLAVQDQISHQKEELAAQTEQQESAAAQTEAQQQALFNSMIEGVLLLDEHGHIRLANQALKTLFGVTADIVGKTMMEALRLHELTNLVDLVSREGQVLGFELDLSGSNRRCLQVNASTVVNQEEKRQTGVILVFHDLTRIKQLENTRQEFVANVSHELRTPLSLIKGYVETLSDGAKDDPAVASRFLQKIEKHADRLTYLIDDLLTISQLESGKGILNFQYMPLRPVPARVIEDLRSRAAEKGISILNNIPEDMAATVDGDRLQQVFFNLVDNAIKYGRKDGSVIISAGPVKDNRVQVSIKDDGPGIPEEATERIFERFYRVDRARSREQGGTGLGLSIVKHIVQSHDGEVWVESQPGQGAIFYFTLPIEKAEKE